MKATHHESTCQWMGPKSESKTCSNPSVPNKSYCTHHVWSVYQEGSAVKGRKRHQRQLSLQDLIDDLNAAYNDYLIEEFS